MCWSIHLKINSVEVEKLESVALIQREITDFHWKNSEKSYDCNHKWYAENEQGILTERKECLHANKLSVR